jgi:hypothetical protein
MGMEANLYTQLEIDLMRWSLSENIIAGLLSDIYVCVMDYQSM